jgi:putative N6-adenine-specific DNA methylase
VSQHPSDDPERPYFASAAKGTEGALRDELKALRVARVKATRGGVYFGGGLRDAARVCLHSRIAMRVLERQASVSARGTDALYEAIRAVEWERVLDPRRTLAVDALLRDAPITHSEFAAQRVKDAIVDRLRDRFGARPDVDKRDPDVRVVLHWVRDHADVSIDLAGAPLHVRGYRAQAGEAPLKETLAAAIVRLSGWDLGSPLIDPLCGAGTIAIEAAQLSARIAPGLARERFGFERWAAHDDAARALMAELREEAQAGALPRGERAPVLASDLDERVLAIARANAARAGVEVAFSRADARSLAREHERALIATNPPYGERLAREPGFERDLAQAFAGLHGYRVAVLAHDPALPRQMRGRPVVEHTLWNGPLECRLFAWDIS